jgi:hypothetical protein
MVFPLRPDTMGEEEPFAINDQGPGLVCASVRVLYLHLVLLLPPLVPLVSRVSRRGGGAGGDGGHGGLYQPRPGG